MLSGVQEFRSSGVRKREEERRKKEEEFRS
jgi:hypothetical protein